MKNCIITVSEAMQRFERKLCIHLAEKFSLKKWFTLFMLDESFSYATYGLYMSVKLIFFLVFLELQGFRGTKRP